MPRYGTISFFALITSGILVNYSEIATGVALGVCLLTAVAHFKGADE